MDDNQELDKQELLEIYKLHAGLADSITKQRGTTNRFYLLILSGLSVIFSTLLQRKNGIQTEITLIVFGIFGALLAAAWYIHIRSHKQLKIMGKFVFHSKSLLVGAISESRTLPINLELTLH